METFETYLKKQFKHEKFKIVKNQTTSFPDYILFNKKRVCFIEAKNWKTFSLRKWKKKQPRQFETYCNLPLPKFIIRKGPEPKNYSLFLGRTKVYHGRDFKTIKEIIIKTMLR